LLALNNFVNNYLWQPKYHFISLFVIKYEEHDIVRTNLNCISFINFIISYYKIWSQPIFYIGWKELLWFWQFQVWSWNLNKNKTFCNCLPIWNTIFVIRYKLVQKELEVSQIEAWCPEVENLCNDDAIWSLR